MEKKSGNNLVLPAAIIALSILFVSGMAFWIGMSNESQNSLGSTAPIATATGKLDFASYTEQTAPADSTVLLASTGSAETPRLVTVSGSVTKTISPDKAVIALSVETLDKSASKSQGDNAETAAKVVQAIKDSGIAESDIKTSGYSLNEEFQWNDMTKKSESVGYRTRNSIQVTVKDLAQTGKIIDAASEAGANSIDSVYFSLSNAKESEARVSALKEASANAKEKAQSIAEGLGIAIGKVYSASENSAINLPYYYRSAMDAGAAESSKVTTPIIAGDIELTTTVTVQFEIQ
ncbi:MAG: SIMPL domain-containing protein [Candidatus ainarchaeum sp.]|nr:SIMPL domain-containing protein [Candidatus ainarchaeum sp.]